MAYTERAGYKIRRYLIGIDDTDNLTSGGTGNLARQLRKEIAEQNLAQTIGITRHQLHLSPEIPYTSHNSSACIMVETSQELVNALTDYCREYLLLHSEDGSDVGLCIAAWDRVSLTVQAFGKQAKEIVLTQEEAVVLNCFWYIPRRFNWHKTRYYRRTSCRWLTEKWQRRTVYLGTRFVRPFRCPHCRRTLSNSKH